MWIFSSFGLIMPSLRPAHTVDAGDPRTIQIRGRRTRDVKYFAENFMAPNSCSVEISLNKDGTIGEGTLVDGYMWETPGMDYNVRTYCTPEALAAGLAKMSLAEIDYVKFKPTTERHKNNETYHNVLNEMWGVLTDLGKPGGKWATPALTDEEWEAIMDKEWDDPVFGYGTTGYNRDNDLRFPALTGLLRNTKSSKKRKRKRRR